MLKNNEVCSIKHFEVLTKKFSEIVKRVLDDYQDKDYYNLLYLYKEEPLDSQLNNIYFRFKSSMHKTKSAYKTTISDLTTSGDFWISYGFENDEFKRTSKPTRIVFRLYFRTTGIKKKLMVRWIIPVTWKNNEE